MTNYYDEIAGPNLLGYQDDIPSYLNAILAQNSELAAAVKAQLEAANLQDNAELLTLIVASAASAITGSFGPVGISWTKMAPFIEYPFCYCINSMMFRIKFYYF